MSDKTALSAKAVEEFVGKAHGDLDRVQELLQQEPALVNAAWNWGGGGWETALGAAAHMGRKDIAELLLARGARIDRVVRITMNPRYGMPVVIHQNDRRYESSEVRGQIHQMVKLPG